MRIGKQSDCSYRLVPALLIRSRSLGFSGALFGPWSAGPALGPWFDGEFACFNRKTNQA